MSSTHENSTSKKDGIRNTKKMLVLVVIGIVAVGLIISISLRNQKVESLAPDFSLIDIDGNNFTLSNNRGKIVVLNFMTTWCPSCKEEIPELESLWALYNETIIIASINIDPFATNEQIMTFRSSYPNATWTWIKDTANVAETYGVQKIPVTVIIDKNGSIAFTHTGGVTANTLIMEIQQLQG
jgi:thiol-disulfide isomerase/thioredoxin